MSILSEINTILDVVKLPSETGYFSGIPPDEYAVVTPLIDTFACFADNLPQNEIQEARISLFSKRNYLTLKNQLVRHLQQADFCITERKYIGFETDTKYHHYSVDVVKSYPI